MRLALVFAAMGILACLLGLVGNANAQDCCIEPSFEHSSNKGPATLHMSGGATVTMFQQTLGDTYGDYFDGDEVLEASGYAGTDDCWYVGAPFGKTTTVNGSHWYVAQNDVKNLGIPNGHNQWGIDLDGN